MSCKILDTMSSKDLVLCRFEPEPGICLSSFSRRVAASLAGLATTPLEEELPFLLGAIATDEMLKKCDYPSLSQPVGGDV